MNICSAVFEPNICPSVLIHMFWPEAQTVTKKKKQRNVHTGSPKCLKYLTQKHWERCTHKCTHMHKKQHMCKHTQSCSLSKSEVTPPPVHARNIQRAHWREREEACERDSMDVWGVTCPLVHAKILSLLCQVQKHIYKIIWIQAEWCLNERATKGRHHCSVFLCMCVCACACFQQETLSNPWQV